MKTKINKRTQPSLPFGHYLSYDDFTPEQLEIWKKAYNKTVNKAIEHLYFDTFSELFPDIGFSFTPVFAIRKEHTKLFEIVKKVQKIYPKVTSFYCANKHGVEEFRVVDAESETTLHSVHASFAFVNDPLVIAKKLECWKQALTNAKKLQILKSRKARSS